MASPWIELPFDRALRRLRRDRAARIADDSRFLLHHAADELLGRLDFVARPFAAALDLGCGDDYLGRKLRERGLAVTSVDAGALFCLRTAGSQSDEDRLPVSEASFDLIVSVGVLDTVNDLPGALIQLRRALRPDGLFLAAFAGAGSLPRLRAALRAAEEAEGQPAGARLHPQIDVRAAGDLLVRAGFSLPVADDEVLEVRYSGLGALVTDLRGITGSNVLAERPRRPFGRIGHTAATAAFAAQADADGRTAEQIHILHLIGWAPSPDQPKPARRGSATASLADALKPKS